VLGIDADIALSFGEIMAQLRRQGNLIEDFDLLSVATVLSNGLTVVTNNTTHFDRVPGLTLAHWVQP